jgi:transketolase
LDTAEEHSIIGGLRAAPTEVVTDNCPVPVERVGIADHFAATGTYFALLDCYGVAGADFVAARQAVATKKS